jgi:Domain of unknown function (DUF397)
MRQRRASSDRPGNRPNESSHFQDSDPGYTYLTGISGAVWKTSSRCSGNGSCVEIAQLSAGRIAMRDGMNPQPDKVVVFTREEWQDFLAGIRT